MSFDPLSAAFELGKTAIDKIWPDPIQRAQELRKLEEMRQNGNLAELNAHVQLMLAQIKVNEDQPNINHSLLPVRGLPLFGQVCLAALLPVCWV